MELNVKLRPTIKYKKRRTLSQTISSGYVMLTSTIIITIVVLSAVYFWVSSSMSQKGYILNQEAKKKEELEFKNRELEREVVNEKSMEDIQSRDVIRKMDKNFRINFVNQGNSVSAWVGKQQ